MHRRRMSIRVRTRRNVNLKIPQLRRRPPQRHRPLDPNLVRLVRNFQRPEPLDGGGKDDCGLEIFGRIVARSASYASAPSSSMLTTRKLYKLGDDVDLVSRIVNGLSAALPHIVFVPAVAGHARVLLAGVSKVYRKFH